MKYLFSVENQEQLKQYQRFKEQTEDVIFKYIEMIKRDYKIEELPQYIVLSNIEMATKIHAILPIPAYTNNVRLVMTPEIAVWKAIMIKQLEQYDKTLIDHIKTYYENKFDNHHLLQIIGHEFVHWSELFLDDFSDKESLESGIWFEEGMAEYISRKYFFTEEEYIEEMNINKDLVQLYESQNERYSIEQFGSGTYDGNYASIFYDYWRSFIYIDQLIEQMGSVHAVFEHYHDWHNAGRPYTLAQWFEIE